MFPAENNLKSTGLAQSPSVFAAPQQRVAIFCLLLVALTLAFYNPIAHNRFVDFDDSSYIVTNPQVQAGLTWSTVKWSFTTFREGNWHPLTWLSHALDFQLFHLNPLGHHYANLLLHTANAVLLFLLLQRAIGFTWQSLLVAALFALHPVNVESVAWAAERKNVLSMLFFLLALHAYDRYARTGRRPFYVGVVLLFSLGLMAKPQVVTLPFVLLLWDYWPLERMAGTTGTNPVGTHPTPRSFWFLVWEKWPLFALAVGDSLVTIVAQRSGNTVRTLAQVSLSARLENVFVSYARYVGKAVWPSDLIPMYLHPGDSLPLWQVPAAIVALLTVSLLVVRRRDRRYLALGWFWFLGTLVPMIGIVTVGDQAMADRYAYLPFIGLFIAAAWSAGDLASARKFSTPWLAACALLITAALGCLTYRQVGHWRDEETLWRYTLSVNGQNYVAHNNLALALAKEGRADEAILHFRSACALHDYPPEQIVKLALYELRVGFPEPALHNFRAAIDLSSDPRLKEAAWSQMGRALLQTRRYDDAATSYRNALALQPRDEDALLGSGLLALRSANLEQAVRDFSLAVQINPSDVNLLLLAHALRQSGQAAEARRVEAQAQKTSSNFTQVQEAVAGFLALAGIEPHQSS
ncbi:MAG: tetratricopeptide repeat protein [Terriglobales bacterium]